MIIYHSLENEKEDIDTLVDYTIKSIIYNLNKKIQFDQKTRKITIHQPFNTFDLLFLFKHKPDIF